MGRQFVAGAGMQDTPGAISKELVRAFDTAIGRYDDWRFGDPEPEVSWTVRADLVPQRMSISCVCEMVSPYDEVMPDHLWRFLERVKPGLEELPIDQSFRSAANFLGRLIKEKKARFDRMSQSE